MKMPHTIKKMKEWIEINVYYIESFLLAEIVENIFKNEYGTSGSEDGHWLAGKETKNNPAKETGAEWFHCTESIFGRFSEQTTEGDERSEASKIKESKGGDTLQRKRVLVVRPVPNGKTREQC